MERALDRRKLVSEYIELSSFQFSCLKRGPRVSREFRAVKAPRFSLLGNS